MKSITQSQAEAEAASFYETVGQSKSEFKPVKLLSQILLIAGSIVKEAQVNLNRKPTPSSGNLSDSLEISDPIKTGSIIRCDVSMLMYGQFVNKGVKGVQSGSSNAGYAFKNLGVSRAFIASLEKGRSSAASKITSTNAKKTVSQNEQKNAKISEVANAWGAAVNIKKFGIKPTGFIDKAVDTIGGKVENQLGISLQVDILNSLQNDN